MNVWKDIKKKTRKKFIEIKADERNPKTQDIKLAEGMPIICHRTNKSLDVLNGDRFKIISINDKILKFTNDIRTENDEKPIELEIGHFHTYFYVAYCITCHASQGETFKERYTIYDWKIMNRRAKYVALSRGTEKNNIQIHLTGLEKCFMNYRESLKN